MLKVKLVLVNIRFRLDISMPVMVINPGIGFGAWQCPWGNPRQTHIRFAQLIYGRVSNTNFSFEVGYIHKLYNPLLFFFNVFTHCS